ncbi:hypothetical protein CHS0354_032128 [Potamilus streckersoni]|uniref:UV radiation resistance-associated gene protein n=1 Tax=Potamilus streckersoni TaxID=2493646 RepID=A0AAE0SEM2_9BIVA|nr:hypothetical protein CHS0354_032128 [Potamilus streckersoni]
MEQHLRTKENLKYTNSITKNPTWQSFDISRYENEIDLQAKSFVVRVWVGHGEKFRLLLDWHINLAGLVFFAEKLQQDVVKYDQNTLITGMFDKFFIAPQITPDREEQQEILVDPTALRNSYTINSLSRVQTVLRAIKQTQASVNRVHSSIEDKLLASQEKSQKLYKREESLMRMEQLTSELNWQMSKLLSDKENFVRLKKNRENISAGLKKRFTDLEKDIRELNEKKRHYFQTREKYIKETAQLMIRRKQIISELATIIYPITEDEKHNHYICNVRLPNSEDFQGQDETMVAVALGYTSHLLLMMSQFLDFPLRYPIDFQGSRSMIQDHIHPKLTDKDRNFPLYSKGREKFQFNYGVFLLNKNTSQLRFYCGLGTQDLRQTLSNIKSMLELRLGVKFDKQNLSLGWMGDKKEVVSSPSNDLERAETVSSLASGGKYSAHDPAEEALEKMLDANTNSLPSMKDQVDSAILSQTIHKMTHVHEDEKEDLFKGTDDHFFQVVSPIEKDLNSKEHIADDTSQEEYETNSACPAKISVLFQDNNSVYMNHNDNASHSSSNLVCDILDEDLVSQGTQSGSPSDCDTKKKEVKFTDVAEIHSESDNVSISCAVTGLSIQCQTQEEKPTNLLEESGS